MIWALLQYLARTVTHRPGDLLGLDQPGEGPEKVLVSAISHMSEKEKRLFSAKLADRGFIIDRPIDMLAADNLRANKLMLFLSNNLDLIQNFRETDPSLLSLSDGSGTLTLTKSFSVDETEALKQAALAITQSHNVRAVVMGHTHETVDDKSITYQYINTGSWTRYYRFQLEEKRTSWSLLRAPSFEWFPYQLNYAEASSEEPQLIRKFTFRERRT